MPPCGWHVGRRWGGRLLASQGPCDAGVGGCGCGCGQGDESPSEGAHGASPGWGVVLVITEMAAPL